MQASVDASACSILSDVPPSFSDGFEWKYTQGRQESESLELTDATEMKLHPCRRFQHQAETDDKVFLYVRMEYCDGMTLHDWLYIPQKRSEQIPIGARTSDGDLAAALALGGQLLQGVCALHEECIVHRDIKPANLLLEHGTGRLRILDFGLARMVPRSAQAGEDGHGRAYISVAGSPGYAAPEQWGYTGEHEKPVATAAALPHPSADIFSVGVVFLELLVAALRQPAGAPVWYTAMERAATLHALGRGPLELPAALLALPLRLRMLLLKMTDPCPTSRPTACNALDEVTAVAKQLGVRLVQ